MTWVQKTANEILAGIRRCISELNQEEVEKLIAFILGSKGKKVFIVGMGRSGFIGRAFALRLMNLQFNVYFLGETITPAASEGDLLIAISGTGTTKMVLSACIAAKEIGTSVVAITSFPKSQLGQMADLVVEVKGKTKAEVPRMKDYVARQITGEREPMSPLGSIFENNCMVFLDCLVVELMHRLPRTEADLRRAHSTIE